MRDNAPCYGCADRELNCHSKCEKFREWKATHEEQKETRYKKGIGGQMAYLFRNEQVNKVMRRNKYK